MKASVKVKALKMDGVEPEVARMKSDPAKGERIASEAARMMDKYVPFRSGALAGGVTVEPWTVKYVAPYAGYVFEGRNMKFSKQHHPMARSHWHEPLKDNPHFAAKVTMIFKEP